MNKKYIKSYSLVVDLDNINSINCYNEIIEHKDLLDINKASINQLSLVIGHTKKSNKNYLTLKRKIELVKLLTNQNIHTLCLFIDYSFYKLSNILLYLSRLIKNNSSIKEIFLNLTNTYGLIDLNILKLNPILYLINSFGNRLMKLNYNDDYNIESEVVKLSCKTNIFSFINLNNISYLEPLLCSSKKITQYSLTNPIRLFWDKIIDSNNTKHSQIRNLNIGSKLSSSFLPYSYLFKIENIVFNSCLYSFNEERIQNFIQEAFNLSKNPLNTVKRLYFKNLSNYFLNFYIKTLNVGEYNMKISNISDQEVIIHNEIFKMYFKSSENECNVINLNLSSIEESLSICINLLYLCNVKKKIKIIDDISIQKNKDGFDLKDNNLDIIEQMLMVCNQFHYNNNNNMRIHELEIEFNSESQNTDIFYFTASEILFKLNMKIRKLVLANCSNDNIDSYINILKKHTTQENPLLDNLQIELIKENLNVKTIIKLYSLYDLIENHIYIFIKEKNIVNTNTLHEIFRFIQKINSNFIIFPINSLCYKYNFRNQIDFLDKNPEKEFASICSDSDYNDIVNKNVGIFNFDNKHISKEYFRNLLSLVKKNNKPVVFLQFRQFYLKKGKNNFFDTLDIYEVSKDALEITICFNSRNDTKHYTSRMMVKNILLRRKKYIRFLEKQNIGLYLL